MFIHVLRLENFSKTTDIAGGHSEESDVFVTTRGYFKERDGFRQLEEGTDQLVWEYEAYTWWRSEFETNINKDTRLVYDGRRFKIVSYKRLEEDRMFYRFRLLTVE